MSPTVSVPATTPWAASTMITVTPIAMIAAWPKLSAASEVSERIAARS